jgi:hypothetical protein
MSVSKRTPSHGTANGKRRPDSGVVEVTAAGLRIDVVLKSETLVDFVRAGGLGSDPVRGLEDVCLIGVLASRTGSGHSIAAEVHRAESALRTMLMTEAEQHIRTAIKRAAGGNGDEGALIPEIEKTIAAAGKDFDAAAARLLVQLNGSSEKSLPQVLDRRVRHAVRDVVGGILESVFASDGALAANLRNNAQAVKDLREELMRLQELLIRTIAASEQVDPARAGRLWQPAVLEDIARLTHVSGDRLEETGDVPGHGRSKSGDGIVHVCTGSAAAPKVAIECRTGRQIISLQGLRKAKINRHADAALLLTEHASALPKDAQPLGFRVYPEDSLVVLHYERESSSAGVLLATAVQVARLLAQLAAGASATRIEQDVVRCVVQRLEACLGRLKPLRGSVTGIETEAGRIRGYAQDIEREARSAVGELAGLTAIG